MMMKLAGSSEASCKCGLAKRSHRIAGGEPVEVNEYPWQVRIELSYHYFDHQYEIVIINKHYLP